ncbi:hypothetical protein [Deinococcus puniceus]|uniref:hypothetical protein n=1 Tax=Deinococcus puniceus TaxID=1182568 RepID=UPI000A500AA5|nr:hypothetical protein [Deinococcus puniceus]
MTGRDDARKRPGNGGRGGEDRKDRREKKGQLPELPTNGGDPPPELTADAALVPTPPAKLPRKTVVLPDPAASLAAPADSLSIGPVADPVVAARPGESENDPPEPGPPEIQNYDGQDDLADLTPELVPMFPGAGPFLARFLPYSPPTHAGLNQNFCDLHAFLKYLHEAAWYGYLHASLGDQAAYVLLFEGRTVTAAAASATGEQALGELLNLYEQGAALSAHPLPAVLAHVLSGIGNRAWKFNLTEDFTGLHARPTGAIFYARGEIVATLPATLPYEGAFPAPLRPQTLILPRSLAGWAHHQYTLTLRGKDSMNAITGMYQQFRTQHGLAGIAFLRALGERLTPAEYAMRSDVALHDLEPLVQEFIKTGCVREGG